jgi:hypothetical protein
LRQRASMHSDVARIFGSREEADQTVGDVVSGESARQPGGTAPRS